jgi:hypothetical protein
MAINLEPVNRGDLITAEFINDIVAAIEALDMKVAALEAVTILDTNIHITAVFPDPIRVGQTLTIVGKNFDFSIGAHRVYIDGIRIVEYLLGSNDFKLIFIVPVIHNLPSSGRQVDLKVSNRSSSIIKTINVLPVQQVFQGPVDVVPDGTSPETITEGQPVTFHFRLVNRDIVPADLLITPTISITAWQPNLHVRDESSSIISTRVMHLEGLEEKIFEVYLDNIPTGTTVTDFTLSVKASADSVTRSSGLLKFTVGSATPPLDPFIHSIGKNYADPPNAYIDDTDEIQLPLNNIAEIGLYVKFEISDTEYSNFIEVVYDVTLSPSSDTSNWQIVPIDFPDTYKITKDLLFESQKPNGEIVYTTEFNPTFRIRPQDGASELGELEFKLQRQGENLSRSKTFILKRL